MSWRSRAVLSVSSAAAVALLSACGQSASSSGGPTWYRDVEPIVSEHCSACHEPGGVGPIVLDFPAADPAAYEHAKAIFPDAVTVLDDDYMPLWLADGACRHYEHERPLSEQDIQIFRDFVNAGSERGNPADAPPAFVPTPLAHVDATLSPGSAYLPVALPALGATDVRCFVLDPALSTARDVIGFDVRPGSHRVHRAAVFSMSASAAMALDGADAGLGYACPADPGAGATLVGEYVPGVPPQEYPAETGIRLDPGSLLVLQVRYDLQSGAAEPDQSEVDLEYADAPVMHLAHFEAISNEAFSIPPLATGFTASATFDVQEPRTLWGVAPHLLAYGRQAHMALSQPAGEACLVDVPNWDASWEQSYFFSNPASISLAPGDSIALTCTWDNPGQVAVVSGTGDADEACVGYAYLSDD